MADKKKGLFHVFFNGVLPENPIFRLVLGMCPTLAMTKYTSQAIGMGLATAAVLVFSNLFISLLRNIISEKVRIPAFVVVIASFVTIVQLLIKAFLPALDQTLGIYIPLIVVNCIIFARAEAFAFKNPPIKSVMDGLGMGIGFTAAIAILASIREVLSHGTILGFQILPEAFPSIAIIGEAPGGFIMLGLLLACVNALTSHYQKRKMLKEEEWA